MVTRGRLELPIFGLKGRRVNPVPLPGHMVIGDGFEPTLPPLVAKMSLALTFPQMWRSTLNYSTERAVS